MTRRAILVLVVCVAVFAAFVGGRWTSPPYSHPTPDAKPLDPFSAERLRHLRAGLTDQHRVAAELLGWLESISKGPKEHHEHAAYDKLAACHAIRFLGEVRYEPAIPFLIREGLERNLWIQNPEPSHHVP